MQERIVESGVRVSCGVITAGPEYGAPSFLHGWYWVRAAYCVM